MKRIIYGVSIFFLFFIIYNLSQSIYSLWQKQDLLVNAQKELERERKENTQLRQQVALVQRTAFVEEEARNKLLLVKPGEQMVILPSSLIVKREEPKVEVKKKENWQQWLELFLH